MPGRYKGRKIILGGIAAFCVIVMTQVATRETLTSELQWCVAFFAFSLPIASVLAIWDPLQEMKPESLPSSIYKGIRVADGLLVFSFLAGCFNFLAHFGENVQRMAMLGGAAAFLLWEPSWNMMAIAFQKKRQEEQKRAASKAGKQSPGDPKT